MNFSPTTTNKINELSAEKNLDRMIDCFHISRTTSNRLGDITDQIKKRETVNKSNIKRRTSIIDNYAIRNNINFENLKDESD